MTLISIIVAFILAFSAPIFFVGRAGYRVRGYLGTLITGAFSFVLVYLAVISPLRGLLAEVGGVWASFLEALVYAISCGCGIALSRLVAKQISSDLRLGFAIGSGQAIAAAAILVLVPYFNSALYLILNSNGSLVPRLMEMGLDEAAANAFVAQLLSVPAHSYILSGAERFVLSMTHIAAAVFFGKYWVLKRRGTAIAILFIPLFAVYLVLQLLGLAGDYSLSYVAVTLMAVAAMAMLVYMSRRNRTT